MEQIIREEFLGGATVAPEPPRQMRRARSGKLVQAQEGVTIEVDQESNEYHVTILAVDYAANHAAAIVEGRMPADEPVPVVRRHVKKEFSHDCKGSPRHDFLATFDDTQRIILCPECGCECEVPSRYRGRH
jgi:hypothetical protein